MRELTLEEKFERPGPKYCEYCGRPMELVSQPSDRFDALTGKRLPTKWYLRCPRWPKSFRNFWTGGNPHKCYRASSEGKIGFTEMTWM